MTGFEIRQVPFEKDAVRKWALDDSRHLDWPVVYVLDEARRGGSKAALSDVYVGETLNARKRLLQHLGSPDKKHLRSVRVVLDDTFNKSACLDLESHLIRLLAGDGAYRILNRNVSITDRAYFDRERYRRSFGAVFERLLDEGVLTRSVADIENDDLFKLSPYKVLKRDQAAAAVDILEGLFDDLENDVGELVVVQGEPGTGKTIIAIYLMKLLADVAVSRPDDEQDSDSIFAEFFTAGYRELLRGFRVGLVVPQQSLRASIQRVFRRTPGLSAAQVLTPFEVGASEQPWDLLIVDEAHRLTQRANQSSGVLNKKFIDINTKLFGADDIQKTQLDWVTAQSRHQLLLVDPEQSVRPADLAAERVRAVVTDAKERHRFFPLTSQLRVRAGDGYISWVRDVFRAGADPSDVLPRRPEDLGDYDLRFFDDVGQMHDAIRARDHEHGLARLVAGYAWEWRSRKDPSAVDISLDGSELRWNRTDKDWINSPNALEEVGSIHTVQGYDLNYAGVIIGPDLFWDQKKRRLAVDRSLYFDKKGKENNPVLGKTYSDEDLLRYITNIYAVLLTRGIRGTYVYVCDEALRVQLERAMSPE
ncbi:MAG: DUF2075 domain-containing protein [Cryobacterium sp.]|nr:DUF2075 domain-containing protein [Cryobacterium sp.]